MKKKLLVLLSSVVAGVGLVGATFAAWAVTDKADPLDIGISPGAVSHGGNTTETLTLEWGETATFADISNLAIGVAQYNSVQVKSTSTGSNVGGKLTLTLADATTGRVGNPPKLIDNIQVKVYEDSTHETEITALAFTEGAGTKSAAITVTNGVAKDIYFSYLIPSTVLPSDYEQMAGDELTLTIDWDKPEGVTEAAHTIYFAATNFEAPYVYAWVSDTNTQSAVAWPGEAMTKIADDLYSYVLQDTYTKVIFSDHGANQTGDLTVNLEKPYFNGEFWVTNQPVYAISGTLNGWQNGNETAFTDDYLLTGPDSDGNYVYDVTTPTEISENWEYKIVDRANDLWYDYVGIGTSNNCSYNTANTHLNIKFNPAKTLNDGEKDVYVIAQVIPAA